MKPLHELKEREKELDSLYLLAQVLIAYKGDEEGLLTEARNILHSALSCPEKSQLLIELSTASKPSDIEPKGVSTYRYQLDSREVLDIKLSFVEDGIEVLEREESLLRSAAELIAETIVRIRLEKKIDAKNQALSELIEQLAASKKLRLKEMERRLYAQVFPALERLRPQLTEDGTETIKQVKQSLIQMLGPEPRPSLPDIPGLTPRELEICGLIQYGLDTKSIAASLHISSETVERHRCTVRKKLGLSGSKRSLQEHLINL